MPPCRDASARLSGCNRIHSHSRYSGINQMQAASCQAEQLSGVDGFNALAGKLCACQGGVSDAESGLQAAVGELSCLLQGHELVSTGDNLQRKGAKAGQDRDITTFKITFWDHTSAIVCCARQPCAVTGKLL